MIKVNMKQIILKLDVLMISNVNQKNGKMSSSLRALIQESLIRIGGY